MSLWGTGVTTVVAKPTDTLAGALAPPAPVHVRVKIVAVVSGVDARLPLVANGPLQPPPAVQAVALVELQVRVVPAPLANRRGIRGQRRRGNGCHGSGRDADGRADRALYRFAGSAAPVHVSVNVVAAVSAAED